MQTLIQRVHPPGSDLVMTAFHVDVKQAQLLKNHEKSFLYCYLEDSTEQFLLCLLVTCTSQTGLSGNVYLKDPSLMQPICPYKILKTDLDTIFLVIFF